MTKKDVVHKWVQSAQEDLGVAKELLSNKRYAYCLFFCQLSLEKLLKALIIDKTDDAPPITHDLVKLAAAAQLSTDDRQVLQLREITTFNVEARYDIHKDRLYKKATQEFTKMYMVVTEELFIWIHSKLS